MQHAIFVGRACIFKVAQKSVRFVRALLARPSQSFAGVVLLVADPRYVRHISECVREVFQ
jgi:hypothetical protein